MKKILNRFFATVIALILVVLSPAVTSATMREEEIYYYSQNGIYFYNPYGKDIDDEDREDIESYRCESGQSSVGSSPIYSSEVFVPGDDNASAIIATLMNNGYTQESAAAIVGNLYAESALNPRVVEGGSIVTEDFRAYDGGKTFSGGFGLVQWTSEDRVAGLQAYADENGLNVTSIEAQVGFLVVELANYGYAPDALNSMSLEDATYEIWRHYENPATEDYEVRLGYAREFLSVEPSSLPEDISASDSSNVSAGGNGEGGQKTGAGGYGNYVNCVVVHKRSSGSYGGSGSPISVDGIVAFLQCDPAWGDLNFGLDGIYGGEGNTICNAGCGPTSFASIAASLGLSVDPRDTADVAGQAGMYVHGSGSSWAITEYLANYYGLNYII